MKLSFITHPLTDTGSVSVVKAQKSYDGASVLLVWSRSGKAWAFSHWTIIAGTPDSMQATSNLIHWVDKVVTKLTVATPETFMRALEAAEAAQVVLVGDELRSVEDIGKISDQWKPLGVSFSLLVNASDAEDAASSIRGRMLKFLKEDAGKAVEIGQWFASGQQIDMVAGNDRPVVVPQSDYHLR